MSKTQHTLRAGVAALIAGAAALTLGAAPAAAEQKGETFAYELNREKLATEQGAAEAYQELQAKARRACQDQPLPRTLLAQQLRNECVADLTQKVVAAANAPSLTRHHAEAEGRNPSATAQRVDSGDRG